MTGLLWGIVLDLGRLLFWLRGIVQYFECSFKVCTEYLVNWQTSYPLSSYWVHPIYYANGNLAKCNKNLTESCPVRNSFIWPKFHHEFIFARFGMRSMIHVPGISGLTLFNDSRQVILNSTIKWIHFPLKKYETSFSSDFNITK